MKKRIFSILLGVVGWVVLSSCSEYGVYGTTGTTYRTGYGHGHSTSGYVSTYAPLEVGFIATTYDRWSYDPWRRCYYDRSLRRYYDHRARRYCHAVPRRYVKPYYPTGYLRGRPLSCPNYLPGYTNRGSLIKNTRHYQNRHHRNRHYRPEYGIPSRVVPHSTSYRQVLSNQVPRRSSGRSAIVTRRNQANVTAPLRRYSGRTATSSNQVVGAPNRFARPVSSSGAVRPGNRSVVRPSRASSRPSGRVRNGDARPSGSSSRSARPSSNDSSSSSGSSGRPVRRARSLNSSSYQRR